MGEVLRQEQQNEKVPCQEQDRRCRKQPWSSKASESDHEHKAVRPVL